MKAGSLSQSLREVSVASFNDRMIGMRRGRKEPQEPADSPMRPGNSNRNGERTPSTLNQILFDRHRSVAARAARRGGTTRKKNGDCAIAFSVQTEKTPGRRQNGKKVQLLHGDGKSDLALR
ncbi:hypothetical protein [Paraburkholderia sp.]|uniref:hypothetical protein n=1 Tax=Paraburkholderia sp. TaxID=1926495 RepID=UPI0039E55C20